MTRYLNNMAVLLSMMLLLHWACTPAQAETTLSTLNNLQISGSGGNTRIEITADKPLTYTYYKMPGLLKAVIDLAIVDPGKVKPVTAVKSDLISKITVEKKTFYDFSLTRVVIDLEKDIDFAVKADTYVKEKLLVTFVNPLPTPDKASGEKDSTPTPSPLAANSVAAPTTTPATLTVSPIQQSLAPSATDGITGQTNAKETDESASKDTSVSSAKMGVTTKPEKSQHRTISMQPLIPVVPERSSQRIVRAIKLNRNNLEIIAESRIEDFRVFTLTGPTRLVIDLPLTKSSQTAKEMPVGRFGVTKARIGTYPDKLRLVFDTEGKKFPSYKIEKTDKGLKITFPSRKDS